MIYVVERNGNKEKIVLPDNARLATAEDLAYFQAKADEEVAARNKYILQGKIQEEINTKNAAITDAIDKIIPKTNKENMPNKTIRFQCFLNPFTTA